jgi:hypothetical protein
MYSKTSIICITWSTCNITIALCHYTRKNAQVDAILMKTGLNNVVLLTLFTVVNNIEQYCYTRFRLNNIVQYCWQLWTTWAAKHCSVLLSTCTHVKTLRLMQYWWKQDWTMFCCPHCSWLSTTLNNIVTPDSGSTILFNIVDKCEQRGQQNIVQSCWAGGSAFFAV